MDYNATAILILTLLVMVPVVFGTFQGMRTTNQTVSDIEQRVKRTPVKPVTNVPNRLINASSCIQVGRAETRSSLVTDASLVGLEPGEWPGAIAVVDDDGYGFCFTMLSADTHEGEITGMRYRCCGQDGIRRGDLLVLNDTRVRSSLSNC